MSTALAPNAAIRRSGMPPTSPEDAAPKGMHPVLEPLPGTVLVPAQPTQGPEPEPVTTVAKAGPNPVVRQAIGFPVVRPGLAIKP